MDERRRRVDYGKLVLQRQLTCLDVDQFLLQSAHWRIVIGDQLDDPANAALDAIEVDALGLGCSVSVDAQTVDLAVEFLAERLEQVRGHQLAAQPVEDRCPQSIEADIETFSAGAAIACGGTAERASADLDVAGAALAALGETGDEKARALPRPERPVAEIRPCVPLRVCWRSLTASQRSCGMARNSGTSCTIQRSGSFRREMRFPVIGS
jgi:hypothetical protein